MWGNINALQLIVHLPLLNLLYPGHLQKLFDRLISVVTFDFLEVFDEEEGIDLQVLPEFTMTQPLNNNCDTVGYGSTNTMDNLGSLNFIISFLLLRIVIFTVQRVPRCHQRAKLKKFTIDKEQLADET